MSHKILIVDDEPDVCYTLQETLEYEGFEVTTVQNGTDALKLLTDQAFDAAIIDLRLEGPLSGLDVIRQVGKFSKRPVILVSSGTPKGMLQTLFEQENVQMIVDGILEKPSDLNPDVFGKKVRAALDKK